MSPISSEVDSGNNSRRNLKVLHKNSEKIGNKKSKNEVAATGFTTLLEGVGSSFERVGFGAPELCVL